MFKYGPHCNGCDSNCKIEIKALGSGIATINDTEIYFGYSQNTKTSDDIIYRTQKICKHLCKHYNTQSNTKNSFTLKSDIHCDGCDKQCKITCEPKNGHWVKIGEIRTPGTHTSQYNALLHGLKICKQCQHYKTR
jgi:hypothetical protein